ncbi:hypothetical protein AVEN_211697-1 [Araneus ventricosus]|uniref:Uncharacterized protein n=1 Tax=Araneus ventricosus TaxID=182803 RepID=A0A4Y2MDN0_ARAVE|nr:hypothetical protein AVEN_211697-1 [Araneus ventricosus]
MASVRIALCIYYDKDIEKMLEVERNLPIEHLSYLERRKYWKQIEAKVVEKLPSLPNLLKTRVSKFIRPIHLEIEKWVLDHEGVGNLCAPYCYLNYKSFLFWKTDGTIDRMQTAKNFVQNKNFDPETRFAMACTYFLEDEVLALWHGEEVFNGKTISRYGTSAAVRFWVKRLKKGSRRKRPWKEEIDGYFKNLGMRDSDFRIKVSCFFSYLSEESKEKYLILHNWYPHSDDFRLCFQAMDERERVELFSEYTVLFLYRCLEWPFQSLFIDMANHLRSHMDAKKFKAVLDRIILSCIFPGFEDFDYAGLLNEFWHDSPDSYKKKIKKRKHCFKVIELVLNYDKERAPLSLPEAVEEFIPKYFD